MFWYYRLLIRGLFFPDPFKSQPKYIIATFHLCTSFHSKIKSYELYLCRVHESIRLLYLYHLWRDCIRCQWFVICQRSQTSSSYYCRYRSLVLNIWPSNAGNHHLFIQRRVYIHYCTFSLTISWIITLFLRMRGRSIPPSLCSLRYYRSTSNSIW